MEMTDNEIYRDWKESKDPAKQVKILADINHCKPAKIIAIIGRIEAAQKQAVSAAPTPVEPVPAEPATDEPEAVPAEHADLDKRLIELYKSGATYKEMVDALPVPLGTIKYHIKKLVDSGEITYRLPHKKSKAKAQKTREPKPERTKNVPVGIPADDMMGWLEALRGCVSLVDGGAKITHVCANDGSQAEVGFSANGKDYLLLVEVRNHDNR